MNRFIAASMSFFALFFLSSDSPFNNNGSVCDRFNSNDYQDIEDLKIKWKDILSVQKNRYYVYIFSPHCGHCLEIRDIVIHYSRCGQVPLLFVEESKEIPFGNEIKETIGATSIEQLWILGYPSLLEIKKGTVIMNIAGASEISQVLKL